MGFKDSFSRLLEKLKRPVAKARRKQKRRESGIAEEKADLGSPVPQPEPHAVAETKHDREENGAVVEASQGVPHLDVEVEVEVPSQQGNDLDGKKVDPPTPPLNLALDSSLDPPTSAPSISYHGEPDSMWARLFLLLPLIIPFSRQHRQLRYSRSGPRGS